MFSGLIEVGDTVFYHLFPGVPGKVDEVDKKKCTVVFFGDKRKKVKIDFDVTEKIVKKSGVKITQVTADTRCFACGGQATLCFSMGGEEICCCNNEECRDYVFEKIKSRHQKALRRDRKPFR